METYLFRRTNARRSRCSSAASVGGPTEIPGRKTFTTAVSRNRTTTPIVDFICVEHSSPHGPASTDRTIRARLPSLFVPIGAKAHRNVERTWLVSANGTFELPRQGKSSIRPPAIALESPGSNRPPGIAQSVKPTCAWQYPSAAQTVQPLPPKGHRWDLKREFPDENRCAHSRSS